MVVIMRMEGEILLGSNRAYKHDMDKQNAADNKKLQVHHTNPIHALEEI